MEPSSLYKVTGAFAAGVILALGGALVYVKTTAPAPAPLVIQNPPAATYAPPGPVPEAKTEVKTQVKTQPPVVVHRIQERPRPQPVVAPSTPTIIQVAQSAPPALPRPIPVVPTRPAVNESQAPMGPQLGAPTQPDPPAVSAPHVVTLRSGTNLVVRLAETVSTGRNYSGDTFRGTLDAPLIVDGFIIADKGSKVLGKVASAQKADLQLTLTEINTTDGQRVPVETGLFEKQASGRGGEDAAKIGGGAALGAIIGAIAGGGKGAAIGAGVGGGAGTGAVLLSHGKPAVLPAETQITFQLSRPATITEKLN